ncbi:carboxymuconolactone decarboxylase family protein [bacterium]|nr:carboxymuconolactone decarboxylase family protein [bacterium]
MSRLKPLKPEEMNELQLQYYQLIRQREVFNNLPKKAPLEGPYNAWIRSPEMIRSLVSYSQYLTGEGILEKRLMELAIITVGRVWSAEFEFAAHAPKALESGIDPEVVDAISRNDTPRFEKADEAAVYAFTMELTGSRRVSDDVYQTVVDQLGEQGVVELVGLAGLYGMVCMTLNTFEVPLMKGMPAPFPEAEPV